MEKPQRKLKKKKLKQFSYFFKKKLGERKVIFLEVSNFFFRKKLNNIVVASAKKTSQKQILFFMFIKKSALNYSLDILLKKLLNSTTLLLSSCSYKQKLFHYFGSNIQKNQSVLKITSFDLFDKRFLSFTKRKCKGELSPITSKIKLPRSKAPKRGSDNTSYILDEKPYYPSISFFFLNGFFLKDSRLVSVKKKELYILSYFFFKKTKLVKFLLTYIYLHLKILFQFLLWLPRHVSFLNFNNLCQHYNNSFVSHEKQI